ncbi:MAG: allophanate hydrolase [Acidimicrobiales bacterium]|nr:allophanate hydrolase [Acidimicrobiales bacterium]
MTVWITKVEGVDAPDGMRLAVKDNIDVAGLPTTCAHPGFAYTPPTSAPAVQRLVDAGMVVVGKTNLDQFATGLVGTRSPYGVVENPVVPGRISGGSSSGSAVAVALGEADVALGTDTAGSGRVPAALCGVVGLKPTRGLVSMEGVVPACHSLDCVSVFARTVGEAAAALHRIAEVGTMVATPVVPPWALRIGVPRDEDLESLDAAAADAWRVAVKELTKLGAVRPVDFTPYFEAGTTVYDQFVAERYDSFGPFLASHPEGADPTVAHVLEKAESVPGYSLAAAQRRLDGLRTVVAKWWLDFDVIAVPTVGEAPTIDEVAADPLGMNTRLGRFTLGCNPLVLCAASVPAGRRTDDVPFGITFLGPAFADATVAAAGARFLGEPDPPTPPWAGWADIFVVGAHLAGQPLNHTLTNRAGVLMKAAATSATYRLFSLATTPPKPGLVRVETGGAAIVGEVWRLPLDQFGAFVAEIPSPLGVGTVALASGESVPGFLCESIATEGVADITHHGGWLAYLDSLR